MRHFILFIFISFYSDLSAQKSLEGRILHLEDSSSFSYTDLKLIAPNFERVVQTDEKGYFSFHRLHSGTYTLVVWREGYAESSLDIDYIAGETKTLKDILIEEIGMVSLSQTNELPVADPSDDESSNLSDNAIASLLNSSRDIFAFNASLSLGQGGYRPRGFNGQDQSMFINGIPMENILRGNLMNFNDYIGLNDVLRSRSSFYGIKAIPFAFGESTHNVDIDAEAISQRKGLRVSQWIANRNFSSRTSISYHTGLLRNHMAYSTSFSFRGASEGYIPGTSMQTISGYLSASRIWSKKLTTSFSAIWTDNLRSVSKASTEEFYTLAGSHYYNPNWGYDGDQKRSASIRRDNAPILILSNDIQLSEATAISLSTSYQMGSRYAEKLDWYNSYSPDPTYYRNAPSYYSEDPNLAQEVYDRIQNDQNQLQIDWRRMREANESNRETVPTQNITGKWARYLLYRDVTKINAMTLNAVIRHQWGERLLITGGVMSQFNSSEQYKQVSDLLGADYYVNINQFAQRANPSNPDAIHNDLNHPFGVVRAGEKYGYDAISSAINISSWAQGLLTWNRVDAFFAAKLEHTSYRREGLYRTGAFADNSYGKSDFKQFLNLNIKGGLTYKINGRNYLSWNAARMRIAPQFNQVFVLPRTAQTVNPMVSSSAITTVECTYHHRGPKTRLYLSGYYTLSENETEVKSIYTELTNSFGTLVLNDMSKRYVGFELAAESKIANSGLTVIALTSLGDYIYSNRPMVSFYYDNNEQVTPTETVYFQGLHLATGPQITGLFKLSYQSKKFWTASIGLNYFDKIFVEPSAQRRTVEAVDNIDPHSELYTKILSQEHLPSAFTVDALFRKSFLLSKYLKTKKRMYFDLTISANNLLNYQGFANSGFEQLRFDFRDNHPEKFPNRYYYMMGRTYSLNFIFRI